MNKWVFWKKKLAEPKHGRFLMLQSESLTDPGSKYQPHTTHQAVMKKSWRIFKWLGIGDSYWSVSPVFQVLPAQGNIDQFLESMCEQLTLNKCIHSHKTFKKKAHKLMNKINNEADIENDQQLSNTLFCAATHTWNCEKIYIYKKRYQYAYTQKRYSFWTDTNGWF